LGTVNADSQAAFTLTETGTHLIQVAAVNYAWTGTYTLGIAGTAPASLGAAAAVADTSIATSIGVFGQGKQDAFAVVRQPEHIR
jgi:ACR3 family arsenite efflux pump ArsB